MIYVICTIFNISLLVVILSSPITYTIYPILPVIVFVSYYIMGLSILKCPRCGLSTSSRVSRKGGQEIKSWLAHAPNPKICSRCGLDFRKHSFFDTF